MHNAHTYACPLVLIPEHVTRQTWDRVTLPASETVSPAQWKLWLGPPMAEPLKPLVTSVPFLPSHKWSKLPPLHVLGLKNYGGLYTLLLFSVVY